LEPIKRKGKPFSRQHPKVPGCKKPGMKERAKGRKKKDK